MLGKPARILSGICGIILGLVTKRHKKKNIIFIEEKNISDWVYIMGDNWQRCRHKLMADNWQRWRRKLMADIKEINRISSPADPQIIKLLHSYISLFYINIFPDLWPVEYCCFMWWMKNVLMNIATFHYSISIYFIKTTSTVSIYLIHFDLCFIINHFIK